MDTEQVLVLADTLCEELGCTIRSLPALAGIAGMASPHIAGISLYRSEDDRQRALIDACQALKPLNSHNDMLARVVFRASSS